MCGDRLTHLGRLAVLACELRADLAVRTLLLVIGALADVVEQTGATRELDVRAELGRDQAGEIADLDRVHEHVLRVRLTELEPTQDPDELWMKAVEAEIEHGL